ncbi:MAG: LLM class flavin-dependent oxidoreductase [Stackebrandtia sp.]
MKVDLFLVGEAVHDTPTRAPSTLVDYGILAEQCGFHGVWIAEHHFIRYGACPSTPLLASHLLARTATLRVGTAACVLSQRHPVALAEEAVMLDGLSGGRFMLGLARGGRWVDLEVFGTGPARYETGFTESLDLLRDWVSGGPAVAGTGRFHRFRPVPVLAAPTSGFGVWIAATSPATVSVAAARGLPLLLGVHTTDEDKIALLDRYRRDARAAGHDPSMAEHAAVYLAYAADTAAIGRRELRESMTRWLSVGVGDYRRLDGGRGNPDQASYVDRLISTQLVGPGDDSARRLIESAERTGISRALLMVEGAEGPRRVRDNITRLGAELLASVN